MGKQYRDKEKRLCVCFVDSEKTFDRISRKVKKRTSGIERTMRKVYI